MKKLLSLVNILIFFLGFVILTNSCNNTKDNQIIPITLDVSFPLAEYKHDRYFFIHNEIRSIEIVFNYELVPSNVVENIRFSDISGNLKEYYDLTVSGKLVLITFKPGFNLQGGWLYNLIIKKGISSIEGYSVPHDQIYEFRTSSVHIHNQLTLSKGDSNERTLIATISDIHCGDARATTSNYSWFHENANALAAYLEYVRTHPKIKELVIQGDLFDEWMVPYYTKPMDTIIGIKNSEDYFKAIANNPLNKPVFDKLREIHSDGVIPIIYIPGNHDMLITKEILQEIIPGIIWKSDVTGLGHYKPVDKILMEHGHRYDFFNCPQPLVNNGHFLPPGYFVTRMYASGLASRTSSKSVMKPRSDIEFVTAWSLAMGYTISNFHLNADTIPMDSAMIHMTGINGYNNIFSFDGALSMYDANIEELWPQTQTINNVHKPMSVFLAILNGKYLYGAAMYEYLADLYGDKPRIVSWGHSHAPDIKVFPLKEYYTGIYANSGSWIDPDESSYKTRTFLIINPGQWSGSELDVVSLYQFNRDPLGDNSYKPILLKEENIKY